MRSITSMTAIAVAAILVAFVAPADAKRKAASAKVYKFCIQCPALSPVPWVTRTCSAKNKTMEGARLECQTYNNFCFIRNYSPKTCK